MFQKSDSAFKIKLLSKSYILFQDNLYKLRDQERDEIFTILNGVVSDIDEVVFLKSISTPRIIRMFTIILGGCNQLALKEKLKDNNFLKLKIINLRFKSFYYLLKIKFKKDNH